MFWYFWYRLCKHWSVNDEIALHDLHAVNALNGLNALNAIPVEAIEPLVQIFTIQLLIMIPPTGILWNS